MVIRNNITKQKIKMHLLNNLKKEHVFWSYNPDSITIDAVSDSELIALTLRYLDLTDIKKLFLIYPYDKIKSAWRDKLVPEGEYLYTLNRFFAWYYFHAKNPDTYLKTLMTRYQNSIYQ
jgi:hypothetical protein